MMLPEWKEAEREREGYQDEMSINSPLTVDEEHRCVNSLSRLNKVTKSGSSSFPSDLILPGIPGAIS
jgi:hypothetical protein